MLISAQHEYYCYRIDHLFKKYILSNCYGTGSVQSNENTRTKIESQPLSGSQSCPVGTQPSTITSTMSLIPQGDIQGSTQKEG